MNVLCVSDVVLPELLEPPLFNEHKGISLILACGDLPPEYLEMLRNRYETPLFYVLGNHDIRHERQITGCTDISGRIVTFEGFRFLGFSGSRWYNGNPNQYHEHEMRRQIRKLWFQLLIIRRLDVIITHAPPRGIHDAEDLCHRGFRCFNDLIKRSTPTYFIHGHIHHHFAQDSERITSCGSTKVVNSYGSYAFTLRK